MSFEKTNCNFINKSKLNEEQIIVDCAFTPENNSFSKMLWIEAYPQIDTVEPLTKEVSFAGKVMFQAMYLDADNNIQKFTCSSPFLNKFISEEITPNSKVIIIPSINEVNYMEQNEKLQAIITLDGIMYSQGEMQVLCGGGDDLCVKTEAITSQDLLKDECVVISEEISYPITDKMDNILAVKSNICIKDIETSEGMFEVDGEINTVIKYLTTSDDIQKVMTVHYSEPFKHEIEVSGLTETGIVELFASVKADAYKYELDNENKKILITAPINLCYRAYEENAVPSAVDLFSLTHNLEIVTNSFAKTKLLKPEFFEEKVEGSITLEKNEPRIDKIVGFSNGNIKITNSYFENGTVFVDGLIQFDIAYLNDETNTINTIAKEIPFSVSFAIDLAEGVKIFAQSQLADLEIISRRGREIFLDGKIKTLINFATETVDAVISNVEQGEPFGKKSHAIEIYFGKTGDELWGIAKELKIKPEIITQQNPDLVLPLEQNENIVIYNQRI